MELPVLSTSARRVGGHPSPKTTAMACLSVGCVVLGVGVLLVAWTTQSTSSHTPSSPVSAAVSAFGSSLLQQNGTQSANGSWFNESCKVRALFAHQVTTLFPKHGKECAPGTNVACANGENAKEVAPKV
jgi:hypothetical protein